MKTMIVEVNPFDYTQRFAILQDNKVELKDLFSLRGGASNLATGVMQAAHQYQVDEIEVLCDDAMWQGLAESIKQEAQRLYQIDNLKVERIE